MSNVSIGGRGGNPIPSTTLVATDQVTIFGDGSGQNPLTTLGANSGQFVPITAALQMLSPGNVVMIDGADARLSLAGNNNAPLCQPLGVVVLDANGNQVVQTTGIVTLPIADWDAVIEGGSSTGLTPRATYYLDSTAGQITIGVPDSTDTFLSTTSSPVGARIGFAISTTEMLLQIGSSPNTIVLPNNGASVGMPVVIDQPASTTVFTPGEANSINGARVNAIAGFVDADGGVVGFTTGMVLELSAATWGALAGTGSAGLSPGETYWLSTATPGHIVNAPPTASTTFQVMVGQALSATKMYIQIGQPVGPHT